MLFRMLRRSLLYHRARVIMAGLATAVGCGLAIAVAQVDRDAESRLRHELRVFGANGVVVPAGAADAAFAAELARFGSRLSAAPGAAWSPVLELTATAGGNPAPVIGIDWPAAPSLYGYWKVEGAWPEPRSTDACLVGTQLAARLHVAPGAALRLSRGKRILQARVAGIVRSGDAADGQCFVSLPAARQLAGAPGAATLGLVSLPGSARDVEQALSAAAAGLGSLEARPVRALAETEGPFLQRARWLMLAGSGAVVLLAMLAVLTANLAAALDREPELALLKALGWRDRQAAGLFLGEAVLTGLIAGLLGGVLGLIAGQGLARSLFGMDLALHPGVLALSLPLGVAISVAGAWLPAVRVLRVEPARVLRAE